MTQHFEIIPAILVAEKEELQRQLTLVRGLVERVQIDILDGVFADNKTVSVEVLQQAHTELLIDVHLMVDNPLGYLNRCDALGVTRVYAQVEQMKDQEEFVESAGDLGMQVGLALDLQTPVVAIDKLLGHLDGVLLMAVAAGFQGQEFDEGVLEKIEELRGEGFEGDICIDGGLDEDTIRICLEKGANHFAVGSELWKAKDIKQKLEELKGIG